MDPERVERNGADRWLERRPRRVALDFIRRYYGLDEMHRQMALIPLPFEPEDDDDEG